MGLRQRWGRGDRPPVGLDRMGEMAGIVIEVANRGPPFGELRRDRHGPIEVSHGAGEVAGLAAGVGPVEQRSWTVRRQAQGPIGRLERRGRLADRGEHGRQVGLGLEELRLEPGGLAVRRGGRLEQLLRLEGHPEIEQRHGVGGRLGEVDQVVLDRLVPSTGHRGQPSPDPGRAPARGPAPSRQGLGALDLAPFDCQLSKAA